MGRQSRMPMTTILKRVANALDSLASQQRFAFRDNALNRISAAVVMTLLLPLSSSIVPCQRSNTALVAESIQERLKPERSDDLWRPSFFKEINKRAKSAGLHRLSSTNLAHDDLEVRVWIGFGLLPLEGFVFTRKARQWSGLHLRPVSPKLSRRNYQQRLVTPNSSWDDFWNRVTREGILTLPDSSQLKDEVVVFDGEHIVVEYQTNRSYRTYRYSNPDLQKWPEAQHIIRIVEIMRAEFNIPGRSLPTH
jgi:hypothetical protein